MQKIRIKKISQADDALCLAADKTEHVPGSEGIPGKSLPVEYEIEGYLVRPIEVGRGIEVDRQKRNGIIAMGSFTTSPVKSIHDNLIRTGNSIYQIEFLDRTDW